MVQTEQHGSVCRDLMLVTEINDQTARLDGGVHSHATVFRIQAVERARG